MHYAARMEGQAVELATAIGSRVRHERQARRWTLDELAEGAGVSRRALVNVEQGTANPSVGTLLRISDALGIGLPALVEPPAGRRLKVIRAGEGATLWTSDRGGRGVLVVGSAPPDVLELWDWTLGAGDRHESEPHTAGTQEALHVLAGVLTVEVGHQAATLQVGEAIAFPGDVAHAYSNTTDQPARFSLTVFEPGVGAGTRVAVGHG